MKGPNWAEAQNALLEIADHALKRMVDEVDIMFFNWKDAFLGVKVEQSLFDEPY
jgi:hypothetical protein